jgi:hypothetical protein
MLVSFYVLLNKVDLNSVVGREISFGHCISVYSGALTIPYPLPPGCSLSKTTAGRAYNCLPPYNGECESVCVDLYLHPSVLLDDVVLKNGGELLLCIYFQ